MFLKGFPTVTYPEGLPCSTNVLDHEASIDYKSGTVKFNGKINGAVNEKEKAMMGGCYKGGLNGRLSNGGVVTWVGGDGWEPKDVCVEWVGQEAFAWECEVTKIAGETKKWNLRDCHNLTPHTTCT